MFDNSNSSVFLCRGVRLHTQNTVQNKLRLHTAKLEMMHVALPQTVITNNANSANNNMETRKPSARSFVILATKRETNHPYFSHC